MNTDQPVRVLIVDDSPVVRTRLKKILDGHEGIRVVGAAPDPFAAKDLIESLDPQVLLLDIEMPKMDGLTFLKKVMKFNPIPTIIVSSLTPRGCSLAMQCLDAGAIQVLCKPGGSYTIEDLSRDLVLIVHGAAKINLKSQHRAPAAPRKPVARATESSFKDCSKKIVCIGSSTGGTQALRDVLSPLPGDSPCIVITQHMPPTFTRSFAERLDSLCAMDVKEAEHGDIIRPGLALIAPGNYHMQVVQDGMQRKIRINQGPRVRRHRPSVDVLFESVARFANADTMSIILTGMGDDGASGMGSLHAKGAHTIAQSKETCVVFGMPARAIETGHVDEVVPLLDISGKIIDFAEGNISTQAKRRQAG